MLFVLRDLHISRQAIAFTTVFDHLEYIICSIFLWSTVIFCCVLQSFLGKLLLQKEVRGRKAEEVSFDSSGM